MDNKSSISTKKQHSISIESRQKGMMSGVEKVVSSNATTLLLQTGEGGLTINGSDLKIVRFDADSGNLSFSGTVNQLKYSATQVPLLKKLFK